MARTAQKTSKVISALHSAGPDGTTIAWADYLRRSADPRALDTMRRDLDENSPADRTSPRPDARLTAAINELCDCAGLSGSGRAELKALLAVAIPAARSGRPLPILAEPREPGTPPEGMQWPDETFSVANKARGENVVQFLERVWLPLLERGAVLRDLRRDQSLITAISNYTRRNPVTGEQKQLPDHLRFPTRKQVNDRLIATAPEVARVAANRARKGRLTLD